MFKSNKITTQSQNETRTGCEGWSRRGKAVKAERVMPGCQWQENSRAGFDKETSVHVWNCLRIDKGYSKKKNWGKTTLVQDVAAEGTHLVSVPQALRGRLPSESTAWATCGGQAAWGHSRKALSLEKKQPTKWSYDETQLSSSTK